MMNTQIFVFGSNLAGRHGKGAALHAVKHHGAIYGLGYGLQRQSFAIPTKDQYLHTLPITKIEIYIKAFKEFAKHFPEYVFNVTRIGCGLAGYKDEEIAPLFKDCPPNINLPESFKQILG